MREPSDLFLTKNELSFAGTARNCEISEPTVKMNMTKPSEITELLTTSQAGKILGIGASRVRQLIMNKRLPAIKSGRDLLIKKEDLFLVADRKPGRPGKAYKASQTRTLAVAENVDIYGQVPKSNHVETAYKMLLKYDKSLCRTAQHKSPHSVIHSEIMPILRLLQQAIKEEK